MGFDYLWLSNGLGFSDCPWIGTGKIFDGEKYYAERLASTKEKIFDFWRLFRAECSYPLETRGTNNSVGIDYASDGVPLYDIYNADLDITAPPNSPWAALNQNFGLEIMGHMTRVCELPNEKFPFRYYLHDPWWINSPWYDRYDGSPCDIYLPMAISRINSDGKTESANTLNILSIDNSFGNMPDSCVNEPLPHLLKAEKDISDEPALLVWVYPMREYTTSEDAELLREMNLSDNYICDAINDGLPLNCVVSTDNFLKHNADIYKKSILISPVPENEMVLEKLKELSNKVLGILIYGTSERLKSIKSFNNVIKLDVKEAAENIRNALSNFGYFISFNKKDDQTRPPTIAISRHDNALMFSVCNSNTTTDTLLKFPLGAPILIGCEAEIKNGFSSYRFSRGEHRECRVFVEQNDGVISCRENPPISKPYRRAIKLSGLCNATVRLFPEKECNSAVSIGKSTDWIPEIDPRFIPVHDEVYGDHLVAENISGQIFFLIGRRK